MSRARIRNCWRSTVYTGSFSNYSTLSAGDHNHPSYRPEKNQRRIKCQIFEVLEPFGFRSSEHGLIMVPAGFVTDFGSVPAFAKWYVDDDDPDLLFPSLPHDLLYSCQGDLGDGRKLTRYQADCVLREAMQACGAPEFKATVVFRSVRVGGAGNWKKKTIV